MIFIIILYILGNGLSFAEDGAPAEEKKVKTVFKKEESHRFSGHKLKGRLKKPEMSYIYQRKGLRAEKIVNVPENFDDEIRNGARKF